MSDPKFPVERADLTRLPWRASEIETPAFTGFHTESASGLRHLARELEHAADWIEETEGEAG